MSVTLAAALELAARVGPVFPAHWPTSVEPDAACSCGNPSCDSIGKHPLARAAPNGHKNATRHPAVIRRWWTANPEANVAIRTGDGLAVYDADGQDGEEILAALQDNTGCRLPSTATVHSGRGDGGRHLYFRAPPELRGRNWPEGAQKASLTLKAAGGYVIAPPSQHVTGRTYTRHPALTPATVGIAPLPPELIEQIGLLAGANGSAKPPEHWAALARDGVDLGSRNTSCASFAGHLLAHEVHPRVAFELLRAWDAQRNRPPLGDDEIKRVVLSIARAEARKWRGIR